MDNLLLLLPLPPLTNFVPGDLIPYVIILINVFIFKLLRKISLKVIHYILTYQQQFSNKSNQSNKRKPFVVDINRLSGNLKFFKLLNDELISTIELCCCCAELNVVYEKHGSLFYGLILFLLTCCWLDAFGEAHTTPGYIVEDYFLFKGNQLFRSGDFYARFIGQSLAMPLAWRFASLYWNYKLLNEHRELLQVENCKTSLTTNTINGFLIEFSCSLLCRLVELIGLKLLDRKSFSQRLYTIINSLISSILVVVALDASGGYFNPVLASSLEFNCKGASVSQHAIVFWCGPLLGHLVARHIYKKYYERVSCNKGLIVEKESSGNRSNRRSTRSSKKKD